MDQATLDPVLDRLAETAHRALGHTFFRILIGSPSGDRLDVMASGGAGRLLSLLPNETAAPSSAQATIQPFGAERAPGSAGDYSVLEVPLVRDGQCMGVLQVGERRKGIIDHRVVTLADALAKQIATALDSDVRPRSAFPPSTGAQLGKICELLARDQMFTALEETLRDLEVSKATHRDLTRACASLLSCNCAALLSYQPAQRLLRIEAIEGSSHCIHTTKIAVDQTFASMLAPGAGAKILQLGGESAEASLPFLKGPVACVPLKQEGRPMYLLLLSAPRRRPFGQLELEVLDRFAVHASHAIEAALLYNPELRTARPLRVLQKLGDFIQSTSDEEKIFHALLTGITAGYGLGFNRAALFLLAEDDRLLEGRLGIGHLTLRDSQEAWRKDPSNSVDDFDRYLRDLAVRVPRPEPLDFRIRSLKLAVPLDGTDLITRALQDRTCVCKSELESDDLPRELVERLAPHSEVAVVPLVVRDQAIGIVICDNKFTNTPIVETDLELLSLFATTAAIAFEHRRKLRSLSRAAHTVGSTNLRNSVQLLLDLTRQAAKAECVILSSFEETDGSFRQVGTSQRDDGICWLPPRELALAVMSSGLARTTTLGPSANDPESDEPTLLCLPWAAEARPLGVMWIQYAGAHRPTEQEISYLRLYADHLATVSEAARRIQRSDETLEIISQVAQAVRQLDSEMLSSIVKGTRRVLGCDTVTLYFRGSHGDLICAPEMEGVWHPEKAKGRITPEVGSFIHTLFERDELHVAEDVSTDEYFKDSRFAVDEDIQSAAAIPLKSRDERVGILFVSYRHPPRDRSAQNGAGRRSSRPIFREEERNRLKLFAHHAAIALQSAATLATQKAQLAQNSALLDLSKMFLASVTEKDILGAAVKSAHSTLGADIACMALKNEEGALVVRATIGWAEEHEGRYILLPGTGSHAGYVVMTEDVAIVENYDEETRFSTPEVRRQHGSVSGIGVPMRLREGIIGAMLVNTRSRRIFTAADGEFLSLLANLTAVAITSANHADNLARYHGRMAALGMALRTIHDSRTEEAKIVLERVLKNAVDNLVSRTGEKHLLGTIQIYDNKSEELEYAAFYPMSLHRQESHRDRVPIGVGADGSVGVAGRIGITGRAVKTKRAQRVGNVKADPDYLEFNDQIRSELAVPLIDDGRCVGAINVESGQYDAFDQEDEDTLLALAELSVLVLRNAERQQDLSHLTHDFKRPISHIITCASTLLSEYKDPPIAVPADLRRQSTEDLYEAVRALAHVQANVLSLAFIQEGWSKLAPGVHDVRNLVKEALENYRWEAEARGISVKLIEDRERPGQINAKFDRDKLVLAVGNLVMNAIKFSNNGGRVELRLSVDPDSVEIEVKDEGCGIDAEDQKRIFERFYRVNRASNAEGSGLGLAIAYEHTLRHGGTLRVESSLGSGSTFRLGLPRGDYT